MGGEPRKRATNLLFGRLEEIERRSLLLDRPVAEQHDAIGEGHGLDLVVGDVNHRLAQLLVETLDLGAHLVAQLGVEVRERLVEQEQARVAHDCAADRDALALPAGELPGQAVQQGLDAQHVGGAPYPRLDLRPGGAPAPSARRRCSRGRSCRGRARSSGTPWRGCGRAAACRSPTSSPMVTVPASTSSSPAIQRSNVDLPQPEGPTRTANSPSAMSRSIPRTAGTLP